MSCSCALLSVTHSPRPQATAHVCYSCINTYALGWRFYISPIALGLWVHHLLYRDIDLAAHAHPVANRENSGAKLQPV